MTELQPITLPDLPERYYWEIDAYRNNEYVYVRLCKTRTFWQRWKYYTDEVHHELIHIEGFVVRQEHLITIMDMAVKMADREKNATLAEQLKGLIKNAIIKESKE